METQASGVFLHSHEYFDALVQMSCVQGCGVKAAGQARVKYLCVTLSIYFEFLKQKLLVTYNINT